MKLRYKLMLAFFLFAVLPLSAVSLYAYRSSTQAFRHAAEAESARMAEEMENRMAVVTSDLGRRIDRLQSVPPSELERDPVSGRELPSADYIARLLGSLGDAAVYLDSLEIEPNEGEPTPEPEDPEPAEGPPVVIRLPRLLESLGEQIARSAQGDEGEGELSAEEVQEIVREVDAELQGNTRKISKTWRIQLGNAEVERQVLVVPGTPIPPVPPGREFGFEIRRGNRPVGHLKATVASERLVEEVLARTATQEGEIAFALDAKGTIYTPDENDRARLESIPMIANRNGGTPAAPDSDWVVVTRPDATTGLTLGLAHPVGESLAEIRRASVRNLVLGLGMALLAMLGILPISHRMTRDLTDVSRGADRLAAGDLDAQVTVRSRDEFGQLARAFNAMAGRLKENQQKLLAQERLRKELEMCRRIQSELLPRAPMRSRFAEVQGVSIPARELGGDFFNYFDLPGGEIALLMGDVAGKGVPAALLMANLQATLRARLPIESDLASFAASLDREVEQSTDSQSYLTLFLGVLDPSRATLRFVNAGHQIPILVRKGGRLELLGPTGRPIGLLSGGGYSERVVGVEAGDCIFLYTDGLVDAENAAGHEFGVKRLEAVLARAAAESPEAMLARVESAVQAHRGGTEAPDDAAMLVLRVGA